MTRIYGAYAYGPGPRDGCWWDETIAAPDWPQLQSETRVDVGIVAGGFTGVSAALALAERGVSVAVLEAGPPGWGASGRNGGFCCLGGSRISDAALDVRFGPGTGEQLRQCERAAVEWVATCLHRHGIDADTHSDGETQLAHSPRAMEALRRAAPDLARIYGVEPVLHEAADLPAAGMNGPFHGALTLPVGFGLNPRKYLFGLARAAAAAGVRFYAQSPVTTIARKGGRQELRTPQAVLDCATVAIATNGYSSDTLPPELAGRYMPAQSNILVTRPLSAEEQARQGWTTAQMAYDSRNLLHYFRLMPDGRFLFGMRGGLQSSARSEAAVRERTRRAFEQMFPGWAGVASDHSWSGMVCLSRNLVPYVGPLPGAPEQFAAFAYHGNGVAMGSWCGTQLGRLIAGEDITQELPAPMSAPPGRFPLGRARRLLMPPIYALYGLQDMI